MNYRYLGYQHLRPRKQRRRKPAPKPPRKRGRPDRIAAIAKLNKLPLLVP
jgi:hypothetical protein